MKCWVLLHWCYDQGENVDKVYLDEKQAEAEADRLNARREGEAGSFKSEGWTVIEAEIEPPPGEGDARDQS